MFEKCHQYNRLNQQQLKSILFISFHSLRSLHTLHSLHSFFFINYNDGPSHLGLAEFINLYHLFLIDYSATSFYYIHSSLPYISHQDKDRSRLSQEDFRMHERMPVRQSIGLRYSNKSPLNFFLVSQ